MITTTNPVHAAAATALVGLIPTVLPLELVSPVAESSWAGLVADAYAAAFVGGVSADVAIVLTDAAAVVGPDTGLVPLGDVLRPALEAATAHLGAGVLGAVVPDDATNLFADAGSSVFELRASGVVAGWFAMRTREAPAVASVSRDSAIAGLGRISSVEMSLTVEIGRTRMSVREVLSLEPGAVIELDRSAGAPADVMLNGRMIARGEIVVIDQDYAVRITEILDAELGAS